MKVGDLVVWHCSPGEKYLCKIKEIKDYYTIVILLKNYDEEFTNKFVPTCFEDLFFPKLSELKIFKPKEFSLRGAL